MNPITLRFSVGPGSKQDYLDFEARLNGHSFFNRTVDQIYDCEHTFDDVDDGHYVLEFILKNKSSDCTKIDQDGNIISDSTVIVKNISIEGVDLDQCVYDNSTYTHDFNGNGPATVGKFFTSMGCNGTVRFEFDTPFYFWLLKIFS